MNPQRIQLRRTKGWRMPPNTVKVDRTTRFGNPFRATEDRDSAACVLAFKTWLTVGGCDAGMGKRKARVLASLGSLRGKHLACWCAAGKSCHADVLLELANQP